MRVSKKKRFEYIFSALIIGEDNQTSKLGGGKFDLLNGHLDC